MSSPRGPLSPDGRYWWDGQAWQPVEAPAPPAAPPPTPPLAASPGPTPPPVVPPSPPPIERTMPLPPIERTMPLPPVAPQPPSKPGSATRSSGALVAGIIAGVLLLGVCAVAVGVAASRGSLGGSPGPAGPSQHQLAQRYSDVVRPDLQSLRSSVDDVRSRCAGFDAIGCRTALRNMQIQAQGFLRDLDALSVPDCFRDTDRELRTGLELYNQGTAAAIQGIDTQNTVLYSQGGSQLDEGSTHMNRANGLFGQASCP